MMHPTIGSIVKLLFASGESLYMTLTGTTSFRNGDLGFTGEYRYGGRKHAGAVELRRIRWNGKFFEANMSE
ncbi:hypothetical protein [Paenibacillus sp. MSJ-34]|uniref:hypothetical protein n=1 Tax=Paenibacillus sp. MSJ-34 TaxID=2841529 RepID=UPI001C10DC93|nr:hypothetical protein [Paenibacillus sp. MSJ-34]MBU5442053.1 hypothetical protein [Paenibacillus sp. MSJ-34]